MATPLKASGAPSGLLTEARRGSGPILAQPGFAPFRLAFVKAEKKVTNLQDPPVNLPGHRCRIGVHGCLLRSNQAHVRAAARRSGL